MDTCLKRIFFSLLKHQVADWILYLHCLLINQLKIHISIILFIILADFIIVLSQAFSLSIAQFICDGKLALLLF